MPRKARTTEETITRLQEAEVALAQGATMAEVCRRIGASDHTFYRWRQEYGGLKVNQALQLRELEAENGRLKRVVAGFNLDK